MAKAIAKTTVKLSFTHDRMTANCKFTNGESIRVSSSRGSYRVSYVPVASTPTFSSAQVNDFLKASDKHRAGELNGQRFARLAAYLETTTSLEQAMARLAEFEAMATIEDKKAA